MWIDGRKFIQLSQLTLEQANQLKSLLPAGSIKKLLFEGIELPDCILYETYEYWFSHYRHPLTESFNDF